MKLSQFSELIKNGRIVKGRWRLTPDHEISYEADDLEEEFKFKGALIAAEPDALVISVTEQQSDQKIVTSLLTLRGTWKVNSKNQITFEIEKKWGSTGPLVFRSGWRVGGQNELIYTYRQENLKTKQSKTRELAFTGFWDISEKNRLTYRMAADSDSKLTFRGAFQSKSILAKKGEIRYQIGAEVSGKRRLQTIILFGKWKVSRDLSLEFEMDYGNGSRAITFGGIYSLGDSRQVAVSLKNRRGESLGVEIVLTQAIFDGDGQLFIRLRQALEETRLEAGASFKW